MRDEQEKFKRVNLNVSDSSLIPHPSSLKYCFPPRQNSIDEKSGAVLMSGTVNK
jgi:hypothetical protein